MIVPILAIIIILLAYGILRLVRALIDYRSVIDSLEARITQQENATVPPAKEQAAAIMTAIKSIHVGIKPTAVIEAELAAALNAAWCKNLSCH